MSRNWELFLRDNTLVQCYELLLREPSQYNMTILQDFLSQNYYFFLQYECPSYMSSCGKQYGSLQHIFHIFHSRWLAMFHSSAHISLLLGRFNYGMIKDIFFVEKEMTTES